MRKKGLFCTFLPPPDAPISIEEQHKIIKNILNYLQRCFTQTTSFDIIDSFAKYPYKTYAHLDTSTRLPKINVTWSAITYSSSHKVVEEAFPINFQYFVYRVCYSTEIPAVIFTVSI